MILGLTVMFDEGTISRFLDKIEIDDNTGCWEWTASSMSEGYGQFNINGSMLLAHRVSFEIHKGYIPEGLYVLHSCDNRLCVNPDHLWLGTQKENIADMVGKGRHIGDRKLTEEDVEVIRYLFDTKQMLQKDLAIAFGISATQTHMIVRRKNWRNI